MLVREGLQRFVMDTAGPLVETVGQWWQRGEIEIFEEHLITEQLHRLLREAVTQVAAGDSNIVALSFSDYFAPSPMREAVARLRAALPRQVELWCGGAGTARLKKAPAGVYVISRLSDIQPQLARWREAVL